MTVICSNINNIAYPNSNVINSYNNSHTSIMLTALTNACDNMIVIFNDFFISEKGVEELKYSEYENCVYLTIDDSLMSFIKSVLTVQYYYKNKNINYTILIPNNVIELVKNVHVHDILQLLDMNNIQTYLTNNKVPLIRKPKADVKTKHSIYPIF
jgi:hypothetical protein